MKARESHLPKKRDNITTTPSCCRGNSGSFRQTRFVLQVCSSRNAETLRRSAYSENANCCNTRGCSSVSESTSSNVVRSLARWSTRKGTASGLCVGRLGCLLMLKNLHDFLRRRFTSGIASLFVLIHMQGNALLSESLMPIGNQTVFERRHCQVCAQ